MKKILWISVAVAALMATGCSDQTKEQAKKTVESATGDAATAVTAVKEKASVTMEEAKKKAAEALEKAKAKGAEMTEKATATVTEKASEVMEQAKAKGTEMAEAAKEKAAQAAETVEKKAQEIKEQMQAGAEKAPAKNGAALFAKCAGCHGTDGKTPALGKSAVIAGQSAEELKKKIEEYKAGTRNVSGMGALMKGQVAGLSEEDIAALADYISKL